MAETKDPRGAILAAGGVIAAAIALSRSRVAKAAEAGNKVALDEATMALLEAIATAQGAILETITNLNTGQGQGTLAVGVVPNADEIVSGRRQVTALNTAVRLPELVIPDDMQIQLKGWPTNAGLIYLASTAPQSSNIESVWPILANEAIGYRIKNLNSLYFSGTAVGDWVVWTVEHRK